MATRELAPSARAVEAPRFAPKAAGLSFQRRLNILIVLEAASGGAARHTVDLAQGLVARGHRVSLAYSPLRANDLFRKEINELTEAGITCLAVPMSRSLKPLDVKAVRLLREHLEADGPFDIVHAQSTKGVLGLFAARGLGVSGVYTPHAFRSLDPTLPQAVSFAVRRIERLFCRLADQVVTVSDDEFRFGLNLGVRPHKLRIIPNGLTHAVGESREALRTQLNLAPDDLCIGFVGRLSHQKAPERALDVLDYLAPRFGKKLRLVMVGFGPKFEEIRDLAEAKGLSGQLTMIEEGNGRELMKAFDIFILTSRYEGMPYVLLESCAAGCPTVSLDTGGARTLIHDGKNGYVLKKWDVAAFAGRVEAILARPLLSRAMAESAAAQSTSYSADRMVDQTVQTYQLAIQHHRRRRAPHAALLKRALDLAGAAAGLVALAPLMALIAVLIRLDGGPALFAHERIGQEGRRFRCLKFRSMAIDSEARLKRLLATDPMAKLEWERDHKLRNDPRITRIGRFLRKSSLDELPQLFNVLKGEMSLVGPRPIVAEEVPRYHREFTLYTATRPGLTGLWQISGRNDLTYEERVALDSQYIEKWSLWLDVKVILMTIPALIKARGVY